MTVQINQSAPAPERVLLAEWGDREVALLGDGLHREPCPVCGHPTMDCTTHITYVPED